MKMRFFLKLLLFFLLSGIFLQFSSRTTSGDNRKEPKLPNIPFDYNNPSLPEHFSVFQSKLRNRVNNEVATLGRVLFYDKALSRDNSVSCSSCHKQNISFADSSQFSTGLNDQPTFRNAPALINLFYAGSFFWDLREEDLRSAVLQPIQHPHEMGIEIQNLEDKLSAISYYPKLFERAFGTKEISKDRISNALTQFLHSLVSANSKFDQALPFEKSNNEFIVNTTVELKNYTQQEQLGFRLFYGRAKCFLCHSGINIDGNVSGGKSDYADSGLEEEYADLGMGKFSANREGYFKVPTLRNAAITAPYMHDGRFRTLLEVVSFYNEGLKKSKNLNWTLRNYDGSPVRMGLTEEEKLALVAFIKTFSDSTLIQTEGFSDPFQ